MPNRSLLAVVIAGVHSLLAPVDGLAQGPAHAAMDMPSETSAPPHTLDRNTLVELLRDESFAPPEGFKALVFALTPQATRPVRTLAFDYAGTSLDRDNWWPASTIKLFAAVAFLEKLRSLGFSPDARLTYDYAEGRESMTGAEVVRAAIAQSNNQAFDRLVELVGFDSLNGEFFGASRGLPNTVLLRSYAHRVRYAGSGHGSNRHSPPIAIVEGSRRRRLPERTGSRSFACADEGNCTTLWDLAETMRRVMLHDELEATERFTLARADRELLRSAMSRARSYRVAEMVERGFAPVRVELAHKPGFAAGWVSDVLFVRRPDTGERWVIALAARGPRPALDDAATRIGRLLMRGRLSPGAAARRAEGTRD